jgi:hypothetical protein
VLAPWQQQHVPALKSTVYVQVPISTSGDEFLTLNKPASNPQVNMSSPRFHDSTDPTEGNNTNSAKEYPGNVLVFPWQNLIDLSMTLMVPICL